MPVIQVPVPYSGLNLKSSSYSARPEYSTRMENFIPGPGYLDVRGPVLDYSDNAVFPNHIYSIWGNANGGGVFSTTTSIYAVNTTIGAPLAAGLTNGFWHGNLWQGLTILCNGVDVPQIYNGTTVVPIAITSGPTPANLYGSTTFKGRVYYWENNARLFWYAAAGAYQGALTSFDLSTFTRGDGYLVSIAPLTIDGGAGPDDMLAFLFSNGEVLVYQGDDPGSATDWQQVGRFMVGEMLGRDCWAIVGSATLVATSIGVVDLARALSIGAIDDSVVVGNALGASGMQARMSTGEYAKHRKLIFDYKNRILWMFIYDPVRLQALNGIFAFDGINMVRGMDIESRSWFNLANVAMEYDLYPGGGAFYGGRMTTAAGIIGNRMLLGGLYKLLTGPDRNEVNNSADVYISNGLIRCKAAQNIDYGSPQQKKMCGGISINAQKIASVAITTETPSITLRFRDDSTSEYLESNLFGYLEAPNVSKLTPVRAVGKRINFELEYYGRSGYRFFSCDHMIKVGNSI